MSFLSFFSTIRVSNIETIPHGLPKAYNLCWMNSICQALATIPMIPQFAEIVFTQNNDYFDYTIDIYEQLITGRGLKNLSGKVDYKATYTALINAIKNTSIKLNTLPIAPYTNKTDEICATINVILSPSSYTPGQIPFAWAAFYAYYTKNPNAGLYLFLAIIIHKSSSCGRVPKLGIFGEIEDGLQRVIYALNIEFIEILKNLKPSLAPIDKPLTYNGKIAFDNILVIERIILPLCSNHTQNIHSLSQFTHNASNLDKGYFNRLLPPIGQSSDMFQAKAQMTVEPMPSNTVAQCSFNAKDHVRPITHKIEYSKYSDCAIFSTIDQTCRAETKADTSISRRGVRTGICINEHLWLMYRVDNAYHKYNLVAQIHLRSGGHFVCVIKDTDGKWYEFDNEKKILAPNTTTDQVAMLIYVIAPQIPTGDADLHMLSAILKERDDYTKSGNCEVVTSVTWQPFSQAHNFATKIIPAPIPAPPSIVAPPVISNPDIIPTVSVAGPRKSHLEQSPTGYFYLVYDS